jgi:hypothetical protein
VSAPARSVAASKPPAVELRQPSAARGAHARKAALFLHTLPRNDRDWMLDHLAPQDRSELEALLAELATLGIPPDRGLLDEIIAPMGEVRPFPAPAPSASTAERRDAPAAARPALEELSGADPKALAALLRDEPAGLVVALLDVREWPWAGALLEALGTARRRDVEAELARSRARAGPNGADSRAALREHVVAVISRHLEDAAELPLAPPVPPPSRWRGLAGTLSRILPGRTQR